MLALKAMAAKLYKRANGRYGNSAKTESETEETIQFLVNDMMKQPLLRVNEIAYILEAGLDGKLDKDDVRHFSSSRFAKWIDAYLEEQKRPAMKKKAQFDHQQIAELTVDQAEEKRILEAFFGEQIAKLEKGEYPAFFQGLDDVFVRCEELKVFDPLDLDEKTAIRNACIEATGYEAEKLRAFSRKVAYLYVLHQAAMKDYTLTWLTSYVKEHDKTAQSHLMSTVHKRLREFEEYKRDNSMIIETDYQLIESKSHETETRS
jgi:hypothetical protein